MIRRITAKDKTIYFTLADEFYHSDAVMHPIPKEFYQRTFDALLNGSTYVDGFIIEDDGKIAGYCLLSKTFSQEAGGVVVWIEELYIRKEFRGKGIAKKFFGYLNNNLPSGTARIRLEVEDYNRIAIALYEKQGFSVMPYTPMFKEIK